MQNRPIAQILSLEDGSFKVWFSNYLSDHISLGLWLNNKENKELKAYTISIDDEGWFIDPKNVKKILDGLSERKFDVYLNDQKYEPLKESPELIPYEKRVKVYTKEKIAQKRLYIHDKMIENGLDGNFQTFTDEDLRVMYEMYDDLFFNSDVSRKLRSQGDTLSFTAVDKKDFSPLYYGYCEPHKRACKYHLYFSVHRFRKMFTKEELSLRAGGVNCWDRLSCLQITFEHELMHVIFLIYGIKEEYDSHGPLFQCMMDAFYGQHGLHGFYEKGGDVTGKLLRDDASVGMLVRFKAKGKNIEGHIVKLLRDTANVVETSPDKGRKWFRVNYRILSHAKKKK